MVAPERLYELTVGCQERLKRGGVVQDAGDERVGELGEPKAAAAVVVPGEQSLGAGPEGQVEVQAGAGPVSERFGHEGGGHAALRGEDVQDVAQGDDPVSRDEGIGVVEVLFKLSCGVLVVVGVVAPAQSVHGLGDGGQVLVHAGDAAGVVAGTG